MKGHDLSFTIPKPYLIGGLSTIVIIFYPIINLYIIMAHLIYQVFWWILLYERINIRFSGIRELVASSGRWSTDSDLV